MLSFFLFKTAGTDISLELELEGFECGTWGILSATLLGGDTVSRRIV